MAGSKAAPRAKEQHGGGPAEGPIPKLNTPSAKGIGASTPEGQGTAQTPSEPQSGLFDIPHLEGTGASEGLGMFRTPIGTSSRASSRPGVGHRPPFPGRRAPSVRSAASSGTHGSRARRPTVLSDIYYETPDIPTWVGEDDTQEYASWTAETEDHLKRLLDDVTEPPRDGMFEKVDPDGLLRAVAQSVDDAVFQSRWERLLHCYDAAMGGKCAALRATAGALRKAEESQNQAVQLKGTMRSFFEEKKVLDRSIAQLEGDNMKQQKQITTLERTNGVLTRDRSTLQTKFTQVCNAREKDLETLGGVISSWESLTGAALGPASSGEADFDTRFDSVLVALKDARAATLLTETRNKRLEEQNEALQEKVYYAENRPKSQQGPSSAELDLKSRVTELELRNQDLERELLEARAEAAKPQESPAKSMESQVSPRKSQLEQLASEETDSLEVDELAISNYRCEVLQRTVDDLKQQLDDMQAIQTALDKISEDIQNTNAIHLEQSQQLADEVKMLARDTSSSISDPDAMNRELDRLRNQLKSNQELFQKASQIIRQQRGRLQATKTASSSSQHRRKLETRSPDHLPDSLGSQPDSVFRGGPYEIKYLDGARKLIEQLKPNLRKEDGPETAVRECLDQLSTLQAEISAVGPYSSTDELVRALDDFLYQTLETGIRDDMPGFLSALKHHDDILRIACDVERFAPRESSAERKLLKDIRFRIHDTETVQKEQAKMIQACEEHRAENARYPMGLSEEIFQLCSSALETSDETWKEAAIVEPLVARVQRLVAESDPGVFTQLVRADLERQQQQLAELGHDLTILEKLADDTKDQLGAVGKLRGKRPAPAHPEDDEIHDALDGALRRREMRLHRLRASVQDCFDRLEVDTRSTQSFLDRGSDADRRQAEMLVTEALVRRNMSKHEMSGGHDESLCFCHLLRTLFPEAYRWCCTTEIQGHGHRQLSPHPIVHPHRTPGTWAIVCNVFTFILWFTFIILVQPRNFLTTLTFLLTFLANVPVYIFSLLTRRPPPTITVPPAEKLVGAAITTSFFYYVLAYIAVMVERRLWVGASDWRYAYVLDLMSGKPLPYAGWSPVRVDSRLAFDPVWTWVSGKVHGVFGGVEAVAGTVATILVFWVVIEQGMRMWSGGEPAGVPPLQQAEVQETPPLESMPVSQPPAELQGTTPLEHTPEPQQEAKYPDAPPVEPEPEVDPHLGITESLFAGLYPFEKPKGKSTE